MVGFNVLLGAAGEALTIRGMSVTGLVNNNPRENWKDGTQDDKSTFLPRNFVAIMVRDADLSPVPQPNDLFTDSAGRKYRVQEVSRRGLTSVCLCRALGNA